MQLASLVHCTHSIVVVLQAGVPPPACMHCMLFVHDRTQRLVAWLQTRPPPPQLAVVRHWTHAPAGEQYRPPPHCASLVQATQLWLALQCGAPVPMQLVSDRHWTQALLASSQ